MPDGIARLGPTAGAAVPPAAYVQRMPCRTQDTAMNTLRGRSMRLAAAAFAGSLLFTAAPVRGGEASTPEARFQQAHDAYERSHWRAAFEGFAGLADLGHAEAARVALQMSRFGPVLYGQDFETAPPRQQRWRAVTADHRVTASQALSPTTAREKLP
jgi:hypothetical protein